MMRRLHCWIFLIVFLTSSCSNSITAHSQISAQSQSNPEEIMSEQQNENESLKSNVLLIHGILMNPLEMRYLGSQLEKSGFNVHYVYYQSVLKSPAENAAIIQEKIKNLKLPNLHLIGHSLGGVLLMHLFDQIDTKKDDLPEGRVVMLGSPVRGSWIAQKVSDWPIVSPLIAKSMPNALSGTDIPDWNTDRDWGMVAGIKGQGLGLLTGGMPSTSDGTVLLEETFHPKQKEHIQVDKSHTALLFSKEVADLTSQFLNTGSFK
ncbi:MAG: pimeloyl-ACP methyl ester carboxylesterase [Cocleimonas sp.]|jgi:pimeloyl-ACP methyl ester carboxylesterase